MSQDEYLPRLPDRWKLTKAIIDHIFLTVVGEAGQGIIEVVEEPFLKKRLNEDLKATFEHAERTFTEKHQDKHPELIEGLDSLGGMPLHTSPDLQRAVLTYYYNPASTDLQRYFVEYLESVYPSQPAGSFDEGVGDYISILERAIFDAMPAFRQSLGHLAALEQRDTLRQIQLILKDLSQYLKGAPTSNERDSSHHFYEQARLPDSFVPRPELLDEIRSSVITLPVP